MSIELKKDYDFQGYCGRMHLADLGIEKYTHKKTGDIALALVTYKTSVQKHCIKVDTNEYNQIEENAASNAYFLATLLNTFFNYHFLD